MKIQQSSVCASALISLTLLGASTARAQVADSPAVKSAAIAFAKSAAGPAMNAGANEHAASRPVARGTAKSLDELLARNVITDRNADGVWAASRNWKALFASARFQFIPFFGSDAPRNAPLTFTTHSITAGGAAVHMAEAAVELDGQRVTLDHGSIAEVYELTPAGVDQQFVLEHALGSGDVRVNLGFDGEYTAQLDHDGIMFTCDLGRVHYGRATAVDAAGRRLDLAVELNENALAITLPASFAATAAYPVTIDPLVAAYQVETAVDVTIHPDVAFDWATGDKAYVWERVFSATDGDIYTVFAFVGFSVDQQSLAMVDGTAENWTNPSISSNLHVYQFLIAAEVGMPGNREIRGRLQSASSAALDPVCLISGPEAGDKWHPVVGGDGADDPHDKFLVVWERDYSLNDHDIHARIVDSQTGPEGNVLPVDNSAATLDGKPSIGKTCQDLGTGANGWTIVWEREASSADHDVLGAQMDEHGSLVHPTYPIDVSFDDDRDPVVSSFLGAVADEAPAYMVAWARRLSPTNRNIFVAGGHGTTMTLGYDVSADKAYWTNDESSPAIDCDAHFFHLAWTNVWGPGNSDVQYDSLYLAGSTIGATGNAATIAGSLFTESEPAVVTRHSGGDPTSTVCIVAYELHVSADVDIYGAALEGPTSLAPHSVCAGSSTNCPCTNGGGFNRGCANSSNSAGAALTAVGNATMSVDSLVLTAAGLPPGAPCLFFQGATTLQNGTQGQGVPFGDGLMCVGGTIVRLGVKFAPAGSASFPGALEPVLSAAGLLPAEGGARTYQGWYRDSASFCTTSTFNLTNGLEVVFVP